MGGGEISIGCGWGVSGIIERSSASSSLRSAITAPFAAKESEIGLTGREVGIGEDSGVKARRLARRKSVS
jgi:hypothetical protein